MRRDGSRRKQESHPKSRVGQAQDKKGRRRSSSPWEENSRSKQASLGKGHVVQVSRTGEESEEVHSWNRGEGQDEGGRRRSFRN